MNRILVPADPPTQIKQSGIAGLKYIVLTWEKSDGADKYVVYVNDTQMRAIETDKLELQIRELEQNKMYRFSVASVNLAGVGDNTSIILKTSDICEFPYRHLEGGNTDCAHRVLAYNLTV